MTNTSKANEAFGATLRAKLNGSRGQPSPEPPTNVNAGAGTAAAPLTKPTMNELFRQAAGK